MNYSSKNTISQQKADGPSDFLGITQSSGLVMTQGSDGVCHFTHTN